MTGPTVGRFAEAGLAEAAIPLHDRGAKFMESAIGMGGNGMQQINLYVDNNSSRKKSGQRNAERHHTKLGYT